MIKEILLALFYLFFFNFLIYRFKKFQFKNFKPLVTHLLFNLKFVVGIFIWVIYTFYYKDVQNNDVHKFYNDALILNRAATEQPMAFAELMAGKENDAALPYLEEMKNWQRNFDEAPFNENHTIIKLNALLIFVSFKTYFVHILFFCFFSLIGWVLLTNSILSFADARNSILALPVLFLPSVLFWTSGVMKEPLLVLGLGLLIYGITNYKLRITKLAAIVCGFILVLFTKFFVLACMLPALVAFLLFNKIESAKFIWLKYAVVNLVLLFAALNIHYIVPRINLQQMLVNKQTNSVKEAEYFKAGSRIDIPALTTEAASVLKVAPVGIWNTLVRPYITESKNVMMLASAAENFFLIPFLIGCIAFMQWKQNGNLNLFLFLVTFSLAYFALVGMCTPVLGNLVRYRTPLLPLFMFAFIIRTTPPLVLNKLSFVLRK
jgi:hypothetical protein